MSNAQGYLDMPKQPALEDLIQFFHAQPGVEYLICAIENQIDASEPKNGGWAVLPGAPYARVGERKCILMYRGEVLQGTSVQVTTAEFFHDPSLPADWFAPAPTKPLAAVGGRKN